MAGLGDGYICGLYKISCECVYSGRKGCSAGCLSSLLKGFFTFQSVLELYLVIAGGTRLEADSDLLYRAIVGRTS